MDGFELKEGTIREEYFKQSHNISEQGMNLDFNLYIISCLNNYSKLTYQYFQSKDFFDFEVSNKTKLAKDNISGIVGKYPSIVDKFNDLEKKLRLELNIPLCFQIIYIEFYDENKNYVCSFQKNEPLSLYNRLLYNLDPKVFHNNSRFNVDYKTMRKTDNNNFTRALEFYNDSFDSDKISNRYILIFSSLESIFNLDSEDITEKLARFSAKLLSENDEKIYSTIMQDIKHLYKKRCSYIHGSKRENITIEDEKLLRCYTRKIIIAYWMIVIVTKKSPKEIIKYLDSDEKLDIQVRMMITALNAPDFSSQQKGLVDVLENEYGVKIPEETKNNILSRC